MRISRHTVISAGFALVLSASVILVAGYNESAGLLAFQILFIAGPTLAPFLAAPKSGVVGISTWAVIAALLITGWSYVAYIDSRPYQGGGASLAPLLGWFTCFVAFIAAAGVTSLQSFFAREPRNLGE